MWGAAPQRSTSLDERFCEKPNDGESRVCVVLQLYHQRCERMDALSSFVP